MLRRRDERATRAAAPPEPKPEKKTKPAKPRAKRPNELERLETEIAARESEVADLEQKLAADWTNVEVLAAHKSSRDALQALLTRWEQLFEQAST
jgi:hypothetical protein